MLSGEKEKRNSLWHNIIRINKNKICISVSLHSELIIKNIIEYILNCPTGRRPRGRPRTRWRDDIFLTLGTTRWLGRGRSGLLCLGDPSPDKWKKHINLIKLLPFYVVDSGYEAGVMAFLCSDEKLVRFKRNFIGTKHLNSQQAERHKCFGTWYQTAFWVFFFNDGGGEGLVQHVSKNTEEIWLVERWHQRERGSMIGHILWTTLITLFLFPESHDLMFHFFPPFSHFLFPPGSAQDRC